MNIAIINTVYMCTSSEISDFQKSEGPQNVGLQLKNREFGGSFWGWQPGTVCIGKKFLCQKRSAYSADF